MTENLLDITELIPTPFLLVEEKIIKKNINRIYNYAKLHKFAVRPHIKTHKSLYLARLQIDAGAVGIAAAKVGEAEKMAELGALDITIAYPPIGNERALRLAGLSCKHKIRVAVDSKYGIDELANAAVRHKTVIGIHIMFDAGLHRCGVSDPDQIIRLAQHIEKHAGLRYEGIQIYLGHLYGDAARDPQSFKQINRLWEPVYEALCSAGFCPQMVSSGSTPSLKKTHLVSHVNEIRVGTAFLNDYFVVKFGHCALENCAARIVATVVSDVTPGQVIIDAGSKGLSAKQLLRRDNLEMGYIPAYPEARIFRLHEEHGWLDVSHCKNPPKIGQRLSIIPVNISLCFNLYDYFYLLTSDSTLQKERIDARGLYV